jgi:hypothetical protein
MVHQSELLFVTTAIRSGLTPGSAGGFLSQPANKTLMTTTIEAMNLVFILFRKL